MTQVAIEALLRQKIGLESTSLGSSTIARAIEKRMAESGLVDMAAYLLRLQTVPQELEELIEALVVPETWFFRDREPFAFLNRYAIGEWLPANPGGVLRVLSVPCSTGEEPYSIAIALLEAGFSSRNFCIDAIDISKRALLKAKKGIYERNSFRGDGLLALSYPSLREDNPQSGKISLFTLREKYFVKSGEKYELSESVRRTVNFINGNLIDPYFSLEKPSYDVIFCRNLLIYLDSAARKKVIRVLERLLTEKGLLFVGHSETGQLFGTRFTAARHPLAFAYRKGEKQNEPYSLAVVGEYRKRGEEKAEKETIKTAAKASGFSLLSARNPLSQAPSPQPAAPLPPPTPQPPVTSSLETARRLADGGELDKAASLCQTYLSQNPLSADGYLLLGEVCQAQGKEEQAEQYLQKAIYLQPDREEALMHLALIKENRGDLASAAVLRQRLQRLQKF